MVKKSTLSIFMPNRQIQIKVFEIGFTNVSWFHIVSTVCWKILVTPVVIPDYNYVSTWPWCVISITRWCFLLLSTYWIAQQTFEWVATVTQVQVSQYDPEDFDQIYNSHPDETPVLWQCSSI